MSGTLLEVEGLTRRFGGVVALDGLTLSMPAGQIIGLIGPNGSGKTTFFNVLTGLYAPNAGRVSFNGGDLTGASPQRVARAGIARTFQRSRLCLELSILDNLLIGDYQRLTKDLWFNLLRRRAFAVELKRARDEAHALLAGFDATLAGQLDQPVANIPMIQRRRIEICRALISRPKLLLLDEPSAGMTHEETRHLMEDILKVKQSLGDLAIIIIEHEMGLIERMCDHCVVLNFGQKICAGSYQEIAADPQVQAAYLGAA